MALISVHTNRRDYEAALKAINQLKLSAELAIAFPASIESLHHARAI
jgi:hypothetical protein